MITGRSAPPSSAPTRSIVAPSARGHRRRVGQRRRPLRVVGLHEHDVERQVEEGRARWRRQRGRQRLVDQLRDLGGRGRGARRSWSAAPRTARGRSPAASPGPSASAARGRRARASESCSCGPTPIALMPLVTPGPAVSAQTPGSRVTFAQPSAANAAADSWRTSMRSMPSVAAAVVEREQMAAREREQLGHAASLQPPRDQQPAVGLLRPRRPRLRRLRLVSSAIVPRSAARSLLALRM